MTERNKKILCIALALAVALCSIFAGLRFMSKAETYSKTLNTLDDKKTTVLLLMTAAATASLVIAAVPSDTTTPIAEQFADLSSDFVVVLCAIFLERILLTLFGKAAFVFLFPAACVLFCVAVWFGRKGIGKLAAKFLALGIAISVIIPGSVWLSDSIESKYKDKFSEALEAVEIISAEDETVEETQTEVKTELETDLSSFSGIWDAIKNGLLSVKDKIEDTETALHDTLANAGKTFTELVSSCKNLAVSFVELLAIMIVTSCIIPVIVVLAIYWLLKSILSVNLDFKMTQRHPAEKE